MLAVRYMGLVAGSKPQVIFSQRRVHSAAKHVSYHSSIEHKVLTSLSNLGVYVHELSSILGLLTNRAHHSQQF